MPQIQIPDFVRDNREYAQERQNAMANRSNLATTKLQQQRIGMENQDMGRSMQKRQELEQLLQSTPETERIRVGIEWAKVNDQELYNRASKMELDKFQQMLPVNPTAALSSYKQATGEDVKYDPASGVAQIEVVGEDGKPQGFLAVSHKGQQYIKMEDSLATRANAAGTIAQATAEGQSLGTQGQRTAAAELDAKKVSNQQQFTAGENEKNRKARIEAARQRPGASGVGMSQFAGIQDGKALIFNPSRGGGEFSTAALPGEGAIRGKTVSFEERRAATNARSGLRAITTVRGMLKDKNILMQASIPGSPGARKFDAARKEMVDVVTRLRTGAAINENEEKFYQSQAPVLLDLTDPEAIEYKLKQFEDLFNDLATGGVGNTGGNGASPQAGGGVMRNKSKSGKPIISKDEGATWEYE